MLETLRRWWSPKRPPVDLQPARQWCEQQSWRFKLKADGDGFLVEPSAGHAWRMEWGSSHRRYLGSFELRMRGDTGLDPQAYAVVMPREQLEALEKQLFNDYVGGVETRVDDATPEEVRWLAVATRLKAHALGPLDDVLGVVGNATHWIEVWMQGPTGLHLGRWLQAPAAPPFVLMAHQGKLTLRMGMSQPDLAYLQDAVALFETALTEARHLAGPQLPAA